MQGNKSSLKKGENEKSMMKQKGTPSILASKDKPNPMI
jgi:hypothetical protein